MHQHQCRNKLIFLIWSFLHKYFDIELFLQAEPPKPGQKRQALDRLLVIRLRVEQARRIADGHSIGERKIIRRGRKGPRQNQTIGRVGDGGRRAREDPRDAGSHR